MNNKYVSRFFKLKAAGDLMNTRYFPNLKELTESMAAFEAVQQARVFAPNDRDVVLVSVADGHKPRTGALFAFRTAWTCYSVDPVLNVPVDKVQRLYCHKTKIEDFKLNRSYSKLVVVAVHSHAPLEAIDTVLPNWNVRVVVAIPCCFIQELNRPPDMEYKDTGIESEKNNVRVWSDTK